MCMCCEIPIYLNKFFGKFNIFECLRPIMFTLLSCTIVEVIVGFIAILCEFSEDTLTDILFYMAIVTGLHATLWALIVYKKTISDLLLVAEYALLMVPLPCLSLFGYTLLSDEIFFYLSHVFQLLFAGSSIYFAVCIHTLYIEYQHKEEQEQEVA